MYEYVQQKTQGEKRKNVAQERSHNTTLIRSVKRYSTVSLKVFVCSLHKLYKVNLYVEGPACVHASFPKLFREIWYWQFALKITEQINFGF
jgi:hypothetical protein